MSLEWSIGSAAYAQANPLRVAMEATLASYAGPYQPNSTKDVRVFERLSLYLSWQGDYGHTCSLFSKRTWLVSWSMRRDGRGHMKGEEDITLEIARQLVRLTGRPELLDPLPEFDDGPVEEG